MAVRHIHRDDFHALGVRGWMEGGGTVLQTLEDPLDLIGPGTYTCTRSHYHRGGYPTFEIHVSGRSRILFHIGNDLTDTEGCVLVGLERGELNGVPAVLNSTPAFKQFMDSLDGVDLFTLVVTESKDEGTEDR